MNRVKNENENEKAQNTSIRPNSLQSLQSLKCLKS